MVLVQNSLEHAFLDLITRDIDTNDQTYETIGDYLEPNERNPEGITKHLALAEEGYIVATGTERVFFDLLFSTEEKCKGIIAVDFNTQATAYVAFNVLMLRISKTREEYVALSERPEKDDFKNRVSVISSKLQASDCPEPMKQYYAKHLSAFAEVYFSSSQLWKKETTKGYFGTCRYDLDNGHFSKLQKYAREGNIIAVNGPINDLKFLKEKKIAVVDTSNISDYSFIDLQCEGDFRPRVIYTSVGVRSLPEARYYSHQHVPISDELRKELDDTVARVGVSMGGKADAMTIKNFLCEVGGKDDNDYNCYNGAIYSQDMLTKLKNRIAQTTVEVPGLGPLNMEQKIDRLNTLSEKQIKDLIKEGVCNRFLDVIVRNWVTLDTKIYLAFSEIPGWCDEFEKQFVLPHNNLPGFLDKLKKNNLFDRFIEVFSQEKLSKLQRKMTSSDQIPTQLDLFIDDFNDFVKNTTACIHGLFTNLFPCLLLDKPARKGFDR